MIMNIREFGYDNATRMEAREAARNFAEWIGGKIYNDRFHNVFIVAWGSGTENMTNEEEL
jgi:hypothetical protein